MGHFNFVFIPVKTSAALEENLNCRFSNSIIQDFEPHQWPSDSVLKIGRWEVLGIQSPVAVIDLTIRGFPCFSPNFG